MNELLSTSDDTTFIYDEMGNTVMKNKGVDIWTYVYEKRNLLEQVEKDQHVIAQYQYDGDGYRTMKTEWIESLQEYQTKIYIYSGTNVIYEKNLNTAQEATYVYGLAGRIARRVGDLKDYYHIDHLGSTRLITDESGNVVTEVVYEPFGEPVTGQDAHYLFSGKERDMSTGLYYYGARYYDPELGRFITRDVSRNCIEDPQSLNKYSYCKNNPLAYVDPDGKMERKFTMDISRKYRGRIYTSCIKIGNDGTQNAQLTFAVTIQAAKCNSEVSVQAALHTSIPYGPGGLETTKATAAKIEVVTPEGSIDAGTIVISWGDMTEGGLEYTVEVYNSEGVLVGFDYSALVIEENSAVIVTIEFSLDPSLTQGENIVLVVTVTIAGAGGTTESDTIIIPSDESLPNDVSIA